MAYTNAPENSTYKTVNLEFTATSWPRNNDTTLTRDPEIINMFFDRNSNENQTRESTLNKRAGLLSTGINLNKTTSTDIINGYFQNPTTGYIYWSVNNKVWRYDGSTITLITTMGGIAPSGLNSVGFCLFLKSTGTTYLMINNGSQLWYHDVTTAVSTQVTDVDLPALMSPHMVFLDGYLFVIKTNTGDIYNSDLDDPTSWTAGNYITAEINPDHASVLTKVKNYILCFGKEGIEFFYNAANPSGSPLGRNESFYQAITFQSSICNIGDTLYFVGRLSNQTLQMFKLDGNSFTPISPSWVDRYLTSLLELSYGSTQIASVLCFSFSSNGHHFLGINVATNFILIYDINEKFWYKWSFGSSFNTTNNRIEIAITDTQDAQTLFATGGQVTFAALNDQTYQDFNTNFTASYKTKDFNADTFNWKTCHRVAVLGDQYQNSGSSLVSISWSDNDGLDYTTARSINVFSQNPYITQTGKFRSRNWKLEYTDQYPWRVWGLSMDLNVGNI